MDELNYEIGQLVRLSRSNEEGEVIGRAEYANAEPSYLVCYAAGDGRQVAQWWGESALTEA